MDSELGRHLSLWRDLPEVDLATTTDLEGLRVAVLEAARVGQMAVTTQATVKVTFGHGTALSKIRDARGERAAQVYAQANQAGFAAVLEMVAGLGIECKLETGRPRVIGRVLQAPATAPLSPVADSDDAHGLLPDRQQ